MDLEYQCSILVADLDSAAVVFVKALSYMVSGVRGLCIRSYNDRF